MIGSTHTIGEDFRYLVDEFDGREGCITKIYYSLCECEAGLPFNHKAPRECLFVNSDF